MGREIERTRERAGGDVVLLMLWLNILLAWNMPIKPES